LRPTCPVHCTRR